MSAAHTGCAVHNSLDGLLLSYCRVACPSSTVLVIKTSDVPRNFVRSRGVNKFSLGQRERGSGGGSTLVRGSGGSCNLVQEISFHIIKFS